MSDEQTTIVAAFDRQTQAEGAIDELWHAGFKKDELGVAFPGEALHQATTATEALEEKAADGAVTGAVTGGALGAIAGTAVAATIPGIGPVLVMGLLLGLTTGAALGTFAGPFLALGLSPETVETYQTNLKAGRCLVVARTSQPERALLILQSHNPEHLEVNGKKIMTVKA
jgi:hypothetical protein